MEYHGNWEITWTGITYYLWYRDQSSSSVLIANGDLPSEWKEITPFLLNQDDYVLFTCRYAMLQYAIRGITK